MFVLSERLVVRAIVILAVLCSIIHAGFLVQVGAASSDDVVLLLGQLEAARSEAESAARQWAADRASLVAAAADLYGELERTHAALEQAVAAVSAHQGSQHQLSRRGRTAHCRTLCSYGVKLGQSHTGQHATAATAIATMP